MSTSLTGIKKTTNVTAVEIYFLTASTVGNLNFQKKTIASAQNTGLNGPVCFQNITVMDQNHFGCQNSEKETLTD